MAKNLSERVRAICGLRSPGGGQLPPPDRRNGSAAIDPAERERQRRARARELAQRMKQSRGGDVSGRGAPTPRPP
jgi:hypothetical protein